MKVRITGLPQQVKAFAASLKLDYDVNYESKPYPQNRKCKDSKYVAVYLDIGDFKE